MCIGARSWLEMANIQTMRTPVAHAMPRAMRSGSMKQVKTPTLSSVHSFRRRITAQPLTTSRSNASRVVLVQAGDDKTVVIGLAADSGCGKSTFMRRVTGIFGGDPRPPAGGNPDSNTLISDMTTVICLDDYHSLDRNGRKVAKVTALAPESQDFDLMYEQVG